MKQLLLISLVSMAAFAADLNKDPVPASACAASSSIQKNVFITHSIEDLNKIRLLPNNTAKQKKLFEWLRDSLLLQERLVNIHYQSILFDKKRQTLKNELDNLFISFIDTEKATIDKNNRLQAPLLSNNPESIALWDQYNALAQDRNNDPTDILKVEAIIDQHKNNAHTEIQQILSYLKKIVELEKLSLFRADRINGSVAQNLKEFTQRMASNYTEYLYLHTFAPMARIFISIQDWLAICQNKKQNGDFSEWEQEEDLLLYNVIEEQYQHYQTIHDRLNAFKNELQQAIDALNARAPKRDPNDYLKRVDKNLGKKISKKTTSHTLY